MTREKPRLRRAFDKAERTIGEPLEELVASRGFTERLVKLDGLRRAVNDMVLGMAAGAVEKALHAAQIPTRGDVRRLNRQLVELATEVRSLSEKVQAEPLGRQAPAAAGRATAKAAKAAKATKSTRSKATPKTDAKARRKARAKRTGDSGRAAK